MARVWQCPVCSKAFQPRVHEEDRAICPHCLSDVDRTGNPASTAQETSTAAPASPSSWRNDALADRNSWKQDEGWRKAAAGLKLIFWATTLSAVFNAAIAGFLRIAVYFGWRLPANRPEIAQFSVVLLGCFTLFVIGALLVGVLLCAGVPYRPARAFAVASIVCVCMAALVTAVGFFATTNPMMVRGLRIGLMTFLALIGVLAIASVVLWMLFHSSVAHRFGASRLALQAKWFIAAWLTSAGYSIGLELAMARMMAIDLPAMAGAEAVGYCFNFAVFVWFETIVWGTFRTIEREIRPSEPAA